MLTVRTSALPISGAALVMSEGTNEELPSSSLALVESRTVAFLSLTAVPATSNLRASLCNTSGVLFEPRLSAVAPPLEMPKLCPPSNKALAPARAEAVEMLPVEPTAPPVPEAPGTAGAAPPRGAAPSGWVLAEAPLSSSKKPEMRSVEATAVSAWAMLASAGDIASRVAAVVPSTSWRTR